MKKAISLILVFALVVSLLPQVLPFAYAASSETSITTGITNLQSVYPEGTTCTNSTPEFRVCVRRPGAIISAEGCWGFAILFVSKLYDLDLTKSLLVTYLEINKTMPNNYPKTSYFSARESLQIGDILAQVNPGHAMVIIGMDDTGVTIGEGNYGGRVHYGRHLSYEAIDQHLAYVFRILPPESDDSPCPCSNFRDMPAEGSSEHEAIDWAYTHKPQITVGTSSSTFSPDENVTRAQALTFLWRAAGMPGPKSTNCPFDDVSGDAYYRKAILWAVENGITCGTSRSTFSPGRTCSRSEVITFLWRAVGSPSPRSKGVYSDVPSGKWYSASAAWAQERAVEPGQSGFFGPNTACTRASTILYIFRALGSKS